MVAGLLGNRSSYLNRFTLVFQSLKMMYDYKLNLTVRTPQARGSSQNIETKKFSKIKAEDGLNFDQMVYDVFNHDLYLCASNQKEEDQALEESRN